MIRVAVTGLGVVTPLGDDPERVWARLLAGESGVTSIRRFDPSGYPTRIAATVPDPEPVAKPPLPEGEGDRMTRWAMVAAERAWRSAGLEAGGEDPERIGVVFAGGVGLHGHRELFRASAAALDPEGAFDARRYALALPRHLAPEPATRRSPGRVTSAVARTVGARGPSLTVDTACASGTQALGDAFDWVRSGAAEVVVAGGADSQITPLGLASFCLLRALSTRNDDPEGASRPFAADRDGFVLGEGAGALILEGWEHARRRGAPILAEIVGFGSSCDAFRLTDPHPEGRGAAAAMTAALGQGGVAPAAVGYVNAHGTSTPANDPAETRALHRAFGPHARGLAISSTKSMIGHLTVAAGAVEAVFTVLTLRDRIAHPTRNLDRPDPSCDLDYLPGAARPLPALEWALSSSFGFGGPCASLLLRRA